MASYMKVAPLMTPQPLHRRAMYNPADTFTNLFAWRSTVWSRCFQRAELYIVMVIFGAAVYYKQYYNVDFEVRSEVKSAISTLATSMIFFLSFYNSQVYGRYNDMWTCTQVGYGRINDLNVVLPAYMKKNPEARDTVMRLVNAYHQCVYLTDAGLPKETLLHTLAEQMLITPAESAQLRAQEDSVGMRLLIWAAQEVENSGIEPQYVVQVTEYMVLLRRAMAYLWSFDDQPVPFIYYNAMNVLMLVVLILKSVDNASEVPVMTFREFLEEAKLWFFLVQTIYVVVLLALRELAIFFFDPFDEGEIPAARYMALHVASCSKLAMYNGIPRDDGGKVDFRRAHKTQSIAAEKDSVDRKGRADCLRDVVRHPQ